MNDFKIEESLEQTIRRLELDISYCRGKYDGMVQLLVMLGLAKELPPKFAGLTKREYFAAMAMQGLIPIERLENEGPGEKQRLYLVRTACQIADALIAELSKEKK